MDKNRYMTNLLTASVGGLVETATIDDPYSIRGYDRDDPRCPDPDFFEFPSWEDAWADVWRVASILLDLFCGASVSSGGRLHEDQSLHEDLVKEHLARARTMRAVPAGVDVPDLPALFADMLEGLLRPDHGALRRANELEKMGRYWDDDERGGEEQAAPQAGPVPEARLNAAQALEHPFWAAAASGAEEFGWPSHLPSRFVMCVCRRQEDTHALCTSIREALEPEVSVVRLEGAGSPPPIWRWQTYTPKLQEFSSTHVIVEMADVESSRAAHEKLNKGLALEGALNSAVFWLPPLGAADKTITTQAQQLSELQADAAAIVAESAAFNSEKGEFLRWYREGKSHAATPFQHADRCAFLHLRGVEQGHDVVRSLLGGHSAQSDGEQDTLSLAQRHPQDPAAKAVLELAGGLQQQFHAQVREFAQGLREGRDVARESMDKLLARHADPPREPKKFLIADLPVRVDINYRRVEPHRETLYWEAIHRLLSAEDQQMYPSRDGPQTVQEWADSLPPPRGPQDAALPPSQPPQGAEDHIGEQTGPAAGEETDSTDAQAGGASKRKKVDNNGDESAD